MVYIINFSILGGFMTAQTANKPAQKSKTNNTPSLAERLGVDLTPRSWGQFALEATIKTGTGLAIIKGTQWGVNKIKTKVSKKK